MEQTKELAIHELALTPAEVVDNATTQAKQLMDIVDKTKCYQEIRGKRYLQVEAWETIGAFNRVHAETKAITPIMRGGNGPTPGLPDQIIGYEAHVQLVRDGGIVGGAIMPCYFTENCCKGKHGDDKHKACMSAAQTFATSKAYRMNYSFVAILAGYQPMPAEEAAEAGEDKPQTKPRPMAIDPDWLRDSLIELHWNDVAKWIKTQYAEAKGQTIRQLVESLSWEHQESFVKEVQNRLDGKDNTITD